MAQLKEEILLETGNFNKNVDGVIRKVEELRKKGGKVGDGFDTSFGKMIEKATGFNGSLGSLIGVAGKFAGALGIVVSAGEIFNKTIHSSQSLTDTFGATQQGVTTVVNSFFQSLANGDFTPFLNGMDNMVSKAKEAYIAMDDLWNMAQSFGVQNARLNNLFQKNLIEIREKKNSKKPEDQERVKELTRQNKEIIKKQAQGGVKLYNQTIKGLQAEIAAGTGMSTKITEGAIYRIVENDINNLKDGRETYKKEYQSYLSELDKLNKQADKDFRKGGMGRYGVNYSKAKNQLEQKYGEAIAANYLLQKKSDKELGEFNEKLKQGIAYQSTAIQNQSKMLRYTKETNEAAKGGKTGGGKTGGGGGKNKVTFKEGSVGWYEEKISELNNKLKHQLDATAIKEIRKEIKATQDELNKLLATPQKKIAFETPKNLNFSGSILGENLSKVNVATKTVPEMYESLTSNINKVLEAYDMGAIGAEKAQELIDSINNAILGLGLKPVKVHVESDAEKQLHKTSRMINEMSDSFSALGQSLQVPELDIAGMIAGAIASVISGYAKATEQAGALNPWAWVAFGLAGLAQVAAIVSEIHNLSGYANGGIIGGSSFAGDNLLVRANSGEMLINPRQQTNLFNLLDRGVVGGAASGNVHFVIKGKDLHGVLSNFNDKMNKVR